MTPQQIKLIHLAARDVDLIEKDGNDAGYRMMLRNIGHVESCKQLTNMQFEDCMAYMETLGFSQERAWAREKASFTGSGGSCERVKSTYWNDKVDRRTTNANERQLYRIRQLACMQKYSIEWACWEVSKRTNRPEDLKPHEAWKLIEMLKSIIARETELGRVAPIKQSSSSEDANARANGQGGLFPDDQGGSEYDVRQGRRPVFGT